jgi:AcrR family transcriptional regulator
MSVVEADKSRAESVQSEAAILDAARDILATRGVEGLSMRQVADQVGVSATAIYHYFDGKQDLVNRVVLSAFQRFGSYLHEAMESHPKGSVERIVALGEAYIRFALENQAYFRVMFSIAPEDRAALEELPDAGGYHLLRTAVAEAVEVGTIRDTDAEVLAALGEIGMPARSHADVLSMFLWSTVHGLVTLALCGAADRCQVEGMSSVLDLYKAFDPFFGEGVAMREEDDGTEKEKTE